MVDPTALGTECQGLPPGLSRTRQVLAMELTEGLRGGELATWIQESLAAEGIERDRLPQQVGDSDH